MNKAKEIKNNIVIIAGMPRAATTFLYHTLQKHPDIYVPPRKELEYFSINYDRGEEWYMNFFKEMEDSEVGFDISPMYFFAAPTPKRIFSFNPDIKVILVIRNPIEFIISFFKNRTANTYESLNFKSFLKGFDYEKDGVTMPIEFSENAIKRRILDYIGVFTKNLLLCDFGAFEQNPLALLKAIENHLEVSSFFNHTNFQNIKINSSDQRNYKLINKLMHQKLFADMVVKLFPKSLIMKIRYRLQSVSSQGKNTDTRNEYIEYSQLMLSQFHDDIEFINMIFKNNPFFNADQLNKIN